MTIKVDLFNYGMRSQCMPVSRTNIRGLYWAICSLQSKAVVHKQLKSSSSWTFHRAQFPKPWDNFGGPERWSHTRPLLKGFLCSVFGKVFHARTQCHILSHVARLETPFPWPTHLKAPFSILGFSACLNERYLEMLPAHHLTRCLFAGMYCTGHVYLSSNIRWASVMGWCVSYHSFPHCLQSAVCS